MFLVSFVPKNRFDSCSGENVDPKPDVSREGTYYTPRGSAGILPRAYRNDDIGHGAVQGRQL